MKTIAYLYRLVFILSVLYSPYLYSQSTSYVQLYPGDNDKFIFQILPDKNYTDVKAFINFYSSANQVIGKEIQYWITNDETRPNLKKGEIVSIIFIHGMKNVKNVKLQYVREKMLYGAADKFESPNGDTNEEMEGTAVGVSISDTPIEDISLAKPEHFIPP